MGLRITKKEHLHINTPLFKSYPMSKIGRQQVFLKFENLQPTSPLKFAA